MRKVMLSVVVAVLLLACKGGKYEEQNLLEYGFPLSLELPKGATVEEEEMLLYKSLVIKNDDNFHMVIFQSEATDDLAGVISDQRELASENPFFVEFVKEDEDGFIYKTVVDSTFTNYNFRHAKVFGQKEYLFQAGLVNQYNQSEIEEMYRISREAK